MRSVNVESGSPVAERAKRFAPYETKPLAGSATTDIRTDAAHSLALAATFRNCGVRFGAFRRLAPGVRRPVRAVHLPFAICHLRACGAPHSLALAATNQSSPPHRLTAFTLIEVLMALVIFAMASVVLGSAYINVLNGYEVAARGMIVDEDVAHARHLVLTEPDRRKVEDGGEFDTADGRRARWSAEITSSTMADLFNVTFTCEIPDPTRPEPVRAVETFVLLRPTWSIDPGERGKLKEEAKTRILELQTKLEAARPKR